MPTGKDEQYLDLIVNAVRVCADYRPKFGRGKKAGYSLEEFVALYNADPFYSWFGIASPLMYAAHKAAGGMTSVYRQIGIGCQQVISLILCDCLGLLPDDVKWSYTIPGADHKERRLSLDGRIPIDHVMPRGKRETLRDWVESVADELELVNETKDILKGAVFEVRQGYKSKDPKRQNADISNAANAYAYHYVPVVMLLSTQIDSDVADRYRRARWLLLRGTTQGTATNSTYVFMKDVVGYDLAGFFESNSSLIRKEIELVLRRLLSGD